LARRHELFHREGIEYWLFGGWAVDLERAYRADTATLSRFA
jgi:hypothetical protein